ncbi:MAG: GTP 3',8-cyclase MoaA [Puniceicoccaceae bacterium]
MASHPPVDTLGRALQSLRISVTDRCNLRCQYCMPAEIYGKDFAFLPKREILTFEELQMVAAAFVKLGVHQIRVTGGEPLLRKDIAVLINQLRDLGPEIDLSLTTNGTRLGQLATALKNAGLNRVNVSLDSLDPQTASTLAGRPVEPERIWKNILHARQSGLSAKVNCVIKRGLNEDAVFPLAERCRQEGITLRFIEFMDVGTTNEWHQKQVVTGREVLEKLSQRWPLRPVSNQSFTETARRYRYEDGAGEVGFINSISEPFCRGCNRARLSADGTLYTCLFASRGWPVKRWIRQDGLSAVGLQDRIADCWGRRDDRYSELRGAGAETSGRPEMWTLGG